jgi:tetratricopeptide (TPR) repeat protein/outer membrane protein assembly factor BamB
LGLLLFAVPYVRAQEGAESARQAQVRALLDRLTRGELKQREDARARLLEIGQDAVPLLEKAAKDVDPERADAAREVLAVLRWKLPSRLEQLIAKPLEDYPSLNLEQRHFALERVAENLREARILAPFLANVARFDPDAGCRAEGLHLYLALTPEGDPVRDPLVLEALEAEAPRKDLHLVKARLLLRLGRRDDALKEARKAAAGLAGDPASSEAILLLADTLVAGGLSAEAIELLEGMARKQEVSVEVLLRLGEAYLAGGDAKKGEETFARILATKIASLSEERDTLLRVARAWLRAGRPEDAQEVLRRALQKNPYDHDVNVAQAELDLAQGRIAQALARLLNEMHYTQRDGEDFRSTRALLAKLFESEGELEAANDADLFEDARRGRPLAKARTAAGRLLLQRGLAAEAARCFREAAALDPDSADARLRLGDALVRLGQDEEAKKAYETARGLAPKDERIGDRLRELALREGTDKGRATLASRPSDVISWDRRFLRDELAGEPEAITDTAPPPVVVAGKVVFVAPGSLTAIALDAAEGLPAFRVHLEPPAPPEGVDAALVGLEVAGLVPVPSAAAAAAAPGRARDATPLVGALVNEWVRPASRSWRKARFETGLLYLIDPKDGSVLDRASLLDEPLSSAAPPVERGSRALALTQPDPEHTNLVLVDLVARRALWKQELAGGSAGRPLFANDFLVAAYSQGVAAFDAKGELKLRALVGEAPQTGVVCADSALWFAASGSLKRFPLDGTAPRDVASAPEGEAFSGDPAVLGSRVFCGTRGGPVRAFDATTGRVLATMPQDKLDKAAARELAVCGNRIFALSGAQDAFTDELPALIALDEKDLAVVWRRPLDRGAALGRGEGMVVASSGSVRAPSGIRVTLARPGGAVVDARPRFLAEMQAAAADALASNELEVGAILARRWIALKGGLDLATADDLTFLGRALALSMRQDEAAAVLEVARARDGSAENAARIEKLRHDLGLATEDAPKPDEKTPGADPKKDGSREEKGGPGEGGTPGGK